MATRPDTQLATRRTGAVPGATTGAGAVDEYLALQLAAVDRIVRSGLDASEAALRLRQEAHRLARESGLDDREACEAIGPIVASAETAIADVQDELWRLVLHSLRLGRSRLGLA